MAGAKPYLIAMLHSTWASSGHKWLLILVPGNILLPFGSCWPSQKGAAGPVAHSKYNTFYNPRPPIKMSRFSLFSLLTTIFKSKGYV